MSITFYAPNSPEIVEPPRVCECNTYTWNETGTFLADCQCCQGAGTWRCYCVTSDTTPKGQPDCPHCGGTGEARERHHEGQMNLANANARALLDLLGIEFDYCGEIPCDQLPSIRRTLLSARTKGTAKAHVEEPFRGRRLGSYVKEGNLSRISCGPLVISCGRSLEQLEGYLDRFEQLCLIAQENNSSITWG